MRPRSLIAAAALFLSLVPSACARGVVGTAPAAPAAAAQPDVIVVEGFAQPEGVRYDPELDAYWVGNVNGDPSALDGNGFVSLVGPDGDVRDFRALVGPATAEGLHAPRGMAISADTLWVVDASAVHRFHRRTREWLGAVDLSRLGPGFPNDVAVAPDGAVYVTDTGASRVYRIVDGQASVALADTALGGPNGITWDAADSRFVLVPWEPGHHVVGWRPDAPGWERLAPAPLGRLDGVERVTGGLLVASQSDQSLSRLLDGRVDPLVSLPGRPADIGIDTRRGRVAVPYMALGRVEIRRLP